MFKSDSHWDDGEFPIAYLITFRTYGTWLHGDVRGSFKRTVNDKYLNRKVIPPNAKLKIAMSAEMKNKPFILNKAMRAEAELAVKEFAEHRGHFLHAVNVLSNHIHIVLSAKTKPSTIATSMKSYITRSLRHKSLVSSDGHVWSRGNSRRYLWKPRELSLSVEYVLYGQGDIRI